MSGIVTHSLLSHFGNEIIKHGFHIVKLADERLRDLWLNEKPVLATTTTCCWQNSQEMELLPGTGFR